MIAVNGVRSRATIRGAASAVARSDNDSTSGLSTRQAKRRRAARIAPGRPIDAHQAILDGGDPHLGIGGDIGNVDGRRGGGQGGAARPTEHARGDESYRDSQERFACIDLLPRHCNDATRRVANGLLFGAIRRAVNPRSNEHVCHVRHVGGKEEMGIILTTLSDALGAKAKFCLRSDPPPPIMRPIAGSFILQPLCETGARNLRDRR